MRSKPSIAYVIEKIDEILESEQSSESKMSFEELLSMRNTLRESGYIKDIKQMDEIQDLFQQLEGLRQNIKNEEEKQEGVKAQQKEMKDRIINLFLEAEKTNQEFKNIPTTAQVSQNEQEKQDDQK